MTISTICPGVRLCALIGLSKDEADDSHSEVDHTRPQSVVERMALPRIRGGTGPIKVAEHGFEG